MKTITKFRRQFWQTCIEYKGSDPVILRDYDIIKLHESGMSMQAIGDKFGLTKVGVFKVIQKYKR